MSEQCPRLRGELLGRRTRSNEKMVNRVGRHKCGVTLWQMCLLPRAAKRHLDRVEVPPDGLEHNFGRRRVYWLENSIFKASHFAVDQSRRRRVKSLEQFISASRRSALRQGLSDAGLVEPRHYRIEFRWASDQLDRLPALAAELIGQKPAVIVTAGGLQPALAAKSASATIPIVFASVSDPVELGLVASLNRPGGNVTGVDALLR